MATSLSPTASDNSTHPITLSAALKRGISTTHVALASLSRQRAAALVNPLSFVHHCWWTRPRTAHLYILRQHHAPDAKVRCGAVWQVDNQHPVDFLLIFIYHNQRGEVAVGCVLADGGKAVGPPFVEHCRWQDVHEVGRKLVHDVGAGEARGHKHFWRAQSLEMICAGVGGGYHKVSRQLRCHWL